MTPDEDTLQTPDIIAAIRAWIGSVEFVPASLETYAPLVTDGLLYFLERLPAARLRAIVGDQLALDEAASPDERFIALLRRCPTLHKLGQVIARESGLPADLRVRLQSLESLEPAARADEIAALVERELGQVPGLTVSSQALAEGSVAYVVPFTWDAAPVGLPRNGVFKALKARAEEDLFEDLAIWPELAGYLEAQGARYGLASLDFAATLDGVANLLRNEIRLDREQARLEWARAYYADSPRVRIPQLVRPLCTPRLTAMERIDGGKITDCGGAAGSRRMLAQSLIEALLAKPFWSDPKTDAVFHADPHAGNLFATTDGRVAIFDWALTTRLSGTQSAAVVQTLLAAATLDEPGVVRALGDLGRVTDAAAVQRAVTRGIAAVRRGVFPGFGWLTGLLDGLARAGVISFPEETALFRKLLLTLTGVVRDVSPETSVDEILVRSGGWQFVGESPARTWAPIDSRAFGTHVSNADLLRFLSSVPWTPTRYMLGTYADVLDALTPEREASAR